MVLRITILTTILTAALTTVAAPASAHTGRCSAEWAARAYHAHADGWWVQDCGTEGRIHIRCKDAYGNASTQNGGWEHRVGLDDAAWCPGVQGVTHAAWQIWNGEPGFPVCTFWFWPHRQRETCSS